MSANRAVIILSGLRKRYHISSAIPVMSLILVDA
jgi:hypothetical protein